jgi:hypothetical protein
VTRIRTLLAPVQALAILISSATMIAPESALVVPAVANNGTVSVAAVNEWTPRTAVTPATLTSSLASHPLAEAAPDIDVPLEGANAWALRIYDIDSGVAPGHIFTLAGSAVDGTGALKVWSDTLRIPGTTRQSDAALRGHLAAHETAERILGRSVELVDFTTVGGDGPSAGLSQWIAYMDLATNGAFTMGIPTAATGAIASHGHLSTVTSVTSKVKAAEVAGVDVVFTTSYSGEHTVLARRGLGSFERAQLAANRSWDRIIAIASDHHAARIAEFGVVVVGHVGDVAAWYCGAGSDLACDIVSHLDAWPSSPL